MRSSLRLHPGLAADLALGGALLGLVSLGQACSDGNEEMLPPEYARITYNITEPTGGTAGKAIVLPLSAPTCERAQQQIKLLFTKANIGMQFTLKGAATSPYQAALSASLATRGNAQVDFQLPQMFDAAGNGSDPANFTTSDSAQDLTCTIGLNVPDPFADFTGEIMCQSASTITLRKLSLFGSFKAVPCPPQ